MLNESKKSDLMRIWNAPIDRISHADEVVERRYSALETLKKRKSEYKPEIYEKKLRRAERLLKEAEADSDFALFAANDIHYALYEMGEIVGIEFVFDDCEVCTGVITNEKMAR